MADDKHYVLGDFYRIDDRTGFKVRAKRTRMEWTGAIVAEWYWEARHPQDFVKGVRDDQTVPMPRPRQKDVFIGAGTPASWQIEPYSDPPLGGSGGPVQQCFMALNSSFLVLHGNGVSASDYPSGF